MLKFLVLITFAVILLVTNCKFSQVYADVDLKIEISETLDDNLNDNDNKNFKPIFFIDPFPATNPLPHPIFFVFDLRSPRLSFPVKNKAKKPLLLSLINLPPPSLI